MKPAERDRAIAQARVAIREHGPTCAGRECMLAAAVLAYVPDGLATMPDGFEIRLYRPGRHSVRDDHGNIVIVDGGTDALRALGLALVAYADDHAQETDR